MFNNPGDKFKHHNLKCTFDDIPLYDIIIYLFNVIYISKRVNQTIKYEEKDYLIHHKKDDWRHMQISDILKSIFTNIKEFIKLYDIDIPSHILNDYELKYTENDFSDSDSDEGDIPIDHRHLAKYKMVVCYSLLEPEFTKMLDPSKYY